MCIPCCDNTYVKYLEKDNVVKLSYLQSLGTNVSITHKQDDDSEFTRWLLTQGHQPPINTEINIDGVVSRFCMCACHHEDRQVIH